MPSKPHWSTHFRPTDNDIDALFNVLLERETPLSATELAKLVIQRRLEAEAQALADKYADLAPYDPAQSYKKGQVLVLPGAEIITAPVIAVEDGLNPAGFLNRDYGDFKRVVVERDGATEAYAAELTVPLVDSAATAVIAAPVGENLTHEEIMEASGDEIIQAVNEALKANAGLVRLAGKWFPRELILDVNVGHLNLAEAVLDMMEGGPLTPHDILEQIGGLGDYPEELQEFSLNFAMNNDGRFDEVGPSGEVLWYLKRAAPPEVRDKPVILRYTPIDYDPDLLTEEMLDLEAEIDDELSPLDINDVEEATVRLIYPHRRLGTLPLNSSTRAIFPTARRAPRIYITLVDAHDNEEYPGWVVHNDLFVWGLAEIYRKHKLPVGAIIKVRQGDQPGQIVIDAPTHKPRVEYLPLMSVKDGLPLFDLQTRQIGATFDEQIILGIDELAPVEALAQTLTQQRKNLSAVLKLIVPALAKLSPQGAAHAKTIYSVVNVLRRTPPGLLLATLEANPDFTNVAGHYWKLSDT